MNKYGEQSWTDTSGSDGEKTTKDSFLRLEKGSNVVRILTLPHAYYTHRYMYEGGPKYGTRIPCSDPKHFTDCPVCEKGDKESKAKRKWFLGVIDRKTNMYKILDIGYSIFKDVQAYAKDDDWGNPSEYDIDIVVNPNGGPQDYYKCVCKPKKPLSKADVMLKEEHGDEELVKRSTPPTREKVQAIFDSIMEQVKSSGSDVEETDVPSTDSSDDNFFKDYDHTKK